MKLKLILTTATVGVALALPSVSSAAPPGPTLGDSVSLTGAPAVVPAPFFDSTIFALNATSGPSGENPSGQVRYDVISGFFHLGGPVTCLAVNGNTATISFPSQMDFGGSTFTVEVVDDQPDTWASSGPEQGRAPTDCSPLFPGPTVPRDPLSAAISRWSIPSRRPHWASASATAGSSSASRIRGCASPTSTEARRASSKPKGCRSRRVRCIDVSRDLEAHELDRLCRLDRQGASACICWHRHRADLGEVDLG